MSILVILASTSGIAEISVLVVTFSIFVRFAVDLSKVAFNVPFTSICYVAF